LRGCIIGGALSRAVYVGIYANIACDGGGVLALRMSVYIRGIALVLELLGGSFMCVDLLVVIVLVRIFVDVQDLLVYMCSTWVC
jgi:hypothetical protein